MSCLLVGLLGLFCVLNWLLMMFVWWLIAFLLACYVVCWVDLVWCFDFHRCVVVRIGLIFVVFIASACLCICYWLVVALWDRFLFVCYLCYWVWVRRERFILDLYSGDLFDFDYFFGCWCACFDCFGLCIVLLYLLFWIAIDWFVICLIGYLHLWCWIWVCLC